MTSVDLRAERLRRGKSVRAMAQIIGVTPRVLLAAERGARPYPDNALKIASFYKFDVLDQWPVNGDPEPEPRAA